MCFFWGTTYLGIRMALESFAPLTLVSVRFTPEQMEDLEHWAEAERLQLAVMCRDLILKEMGRNRGLIQKIREFRQGLTKSLRQYAKERGIPGDAT